MAAVADYSFSRPDPHALKAAGYGGVMRYLAPDNPSTHGKLIFPAEYQALLAAGLTVTLNFEWTTTRATQGHDAGYSDAQVAGQQADALGYPAGSAIYYSVDESATVDAVRPYFQGIHDAGGRPAGFYGGQPIGLELMREGLVSHLWVANAASWSGFPSWDSLRANVAPEAHLIQHLDHPLGFDGQVDHNEVLRDDYQGDSDVTNDEHDAIMATALVAKQAHDWTEALFNAVFNFQNKSGLTTIDGRVQALAGAVAKLASAPAPGQTVDVSAIVAAIQALPEATAKQVLSDLGTALSSH